MTNRGPTYAIDVPVDAFFLVELSQMGEPLTHQEGERLKAYDRLARLGLTEMAQSSVTGGNGWRVTSRGAIVAQGFREVLGIRSAPP